MAVRLRTDHSSAQERAQPLVPARSPPLPSSPEWQKDGIVGEAEEKKIDLQHITKSLESGVDPYLNPWSQEDSDDEEDTPTRHPHREVYSGTERRVSDRERDRSVFGDKALEETLLSAFVEYVKEKGINGLRKTQINSA